MSKLADRLRAVGVVNTWDLLVRFGTAADVSVEYWPSPPGRLGWGRVRHTKVSSPRPHPQLERPALGSGYHREFFGARAASFPQALEFAREITGQEFVRAPTGAHVPKRVMDRAEAAVKTAEKASGNV